MSTSPPPPDRPTERIQPVERVQPVVAPQQPIYEERIVAPAVDPTVILLRLEDAIGSLRTGLTIVGIIAVAALGVAIYGLLKEDDAGNQSRSGLATDARVSQLDDRIDRLSRQVQGARAGGGATSAALEARVKGVEDTVKTLASRPAADPQQAIDQLSSRIDTLAKDVEALKQAPTTAP